jgi:sugar lactone lactonase YvrE
MNKTLTYKTLAIFFALFPCELTQAQNLLRAPQKIVVDAARNRLLVSNYDTGALVQIDSTGAQTYFLQNAGFVDGCEIVGDTIYGVGNDRKFYAYNLITKQPVLNLTLTGNAADYLSSVAYDSAGHLFISCPNLNEIYRLRLSDHKWWIFAKGNGLRKPNGILLEKEKNRIVIIDDSPSPALIHAISLTDTTVTTLRSTTFNSPDGIVRDKFGYYYVGGYYLTSVYRFDPDFIAAPRGIYNGRNMVYPTYDPKDHSILITLYGTNSWARIPCTTSALGTHPIDQDPFSCSVFPNPFTTSLTIRFELNKRVKVTLEAYNAAGARVSTLISAEKDPGIHTVSWNGLDDAGLRVPGGVYFFRLSRDGVGETKRAIRID